MVVNDFLSTLETIWGCTVRAALEEWRRDYNTARSHSRIGWLTPSAYAAQFSPKPGHGAAPAYGSAPWPVASPEQMKKISRQAQGPAG